MPGVLRPRVRGDHRAARGRARARRHAAGATRASWIPFTSTENEQVGLDLMASGARESAPKRRYPARRCARRDLGVRPAARGVRGASDHRQVPHRRPPEPVEAVTLAVRTAPATATRRRRPRARDRRRRRGDRADRRRRQGQARGARHRDRGVRELRRSTPGGTPERDPRHARVSHHVRRLSGRRPGRRRVDVSPVRAGAHHRGTVGRRPKPRTSCATVRRSARRTRGLYIGDSIRSGARTSMLRLPRATSSSDREPRIRSPPGTHGAARAVST